MQLGDQSRAGAKLLTRWVLLEPVRAGKDCFVPADRRCSKYWAVALCLCQGSWSYGFSLRQGCGGGEPNLSPHVVDHIAERKAQRPFVLKRRFPFDSRVVAGATAVVPAFRLTGWMS
jgi:hypothetical protein